MSGKKALNPRMLAIVLTAFLVLVAVVLFVYSESKAKSASSDLEYYFVTEVSDSGKQLVKPSKDETYSLKANTAYQVSLTADGTVNNGYCKVLSDATDDILTTQQIARKSTITFTLIPEKDAAYTFLAVTGTNMLSADITDSCTIGQSQNTEAKKAEEIQATDAAADAADTGTDDSSDWYDDDDDHYWYDDDDGYDYSYSWSYSTPSSSSSSGSSSSSTPAAPSSNSSSSSSASSTPASSSSESSSSGSSSGSSDSSTPVETPSDAASTPSEGGSADDSGSSDTGNTDTGSSGATEIQ